MHSPLVITLDLDEATMARFQDERAELFPPHRTQVGAHLTLFHAVPGEMQAQVLADIQSAAERPPFDVAVCKVVSLGKGAAYSLEATELSELRARLRQGWAAHLTPQDSQGFRPHVTVQNKVDPTTARETVRRLQAAFVPFTARAEAVVVWRYVGGPWELVQRMPLAGGDASRR